MTTRRIISTDSRVGPTTPRVAGVAACLLAAACAPVFKAADAPQYLVDQEAAHLASNASQAAYERIGNGIELRAENVSNAFERLTEVADPLCAVEDSECTFSYRIVDDFSPNAYMDDAGTAYLTLGTLMLLETEDELAFVLGHEMGHHIAEHAEEQETRAAIGALALGMLGALGAAAGAYNDPYTGAYDYARANRDITNLVEAGASLGRRTFSQSQEAEADYLALLMVKEAGYDPRAGIGAFEALSSYIQGEQVETSFFGSHPGFAERIARLKTAIAEGRTLQSETTKTD